MSTVISVEHLSKSYRLGQINTGTFTHDLQLWWAKLRGKPSPWQNIGEPDDSHRDGEIIWALKDVSFQVEQGEVLGIVGRNGAGKSTLLKILSRVTSPTLGKVKIKGRIASLLEVGTGFHPDLTGRENIYLNGAILGMSKQEVARKFDEIVDFSGVEKFIDTPVKRYSSGMYVRLAFAVAAHLEPEILVVDEVLAVGDAEFQKKCLGKMGEVAHQGRTVLFVSHNMAAIKKLCTNTILIEHGRLIEQGMTERVVETYLSPVQLSNDNPKEYYRPWRNCTQSLRITDVEVQAPQTFDDPFCFTIKYEVHSILEKFSVEWFIKDANGNRVICGFSALSEGAWFKPHGTTGSIRCSINNWRFSDGQYSLSIMLTITLLQCIDFVEDAINFEIRDMSPGKAGFIFSSLYGLVLPETSWDTEDNTEIFYEKFL